jgi:hypothetical protein
VSPSIPELQPSGDGIARSSTVFYPVFVTDLTSLKIRKIAGCQQSNSHAEAPLTIAKYNSFFTIVKFETKIFLRGGLWNSERSEDIRSAGCQPAFSCGAGSIGPQPISKKEAPGPIEIRVSP